MHRTDCIMQRETVRCLFVLKFQYKKMIAFKSIFIYLHLGHKNSTYIIFLLS